MDPLDRLCWTHFCSRPSLCGAFTVWLGSFTKSRFPSSARERSNIPSRDIEVLKHDKELQIIPIKISIRYSTRVIMPSPENLEENYQINSKACLEQGIESGKFIPPREKY